VETGIASADTAFTIVTKDFVISANERRWSVPAGEAVRDIPEAASTGTVSYPSALGHFWNEILPSYVALDALLPPSVPILRAHSGTSGATLDELVRLGVFHPLRQWIDVGPGRSLVRINRLYFLRSDNLWTETPVVNWYSQRLLANRLLRVVRGASSAHVGIVRGKNLSVLVLQREEGRARSINNHADIIAAVRRVLPRASVDAFIPSSATPELLMATATRTHAACLVIGPHGANMNSIVWMEPGCWVVEIGFIDGGFQMPTDFYGLARNLNLTYWLSVATAGGYSNPLTADIGDLEFILREYLSAMVFNLPSEREMSRPARAATHGLHVSEWSNHSLLRRMPGV
jgi:hypothetical protein